MKSPRFHLRSSEWILTGSLLILLFSLFAISKIKAMQAGEPLEKKIIIVQVEIDGWVKKPGIYAVSRGSPIEEVLRKALPKKFADLRKIPLKDPISHPVQLHIECLKELTVTVEGAVQTPGEIRVPPGTKISDLKKILVLARDADPAYFKKKRMLQDGEIVKVPSRID